MTTLTNPVPRVTSPQPIPHPKSSARAAAPSFSPPDVRYAPGLGTARRMGWFGIGLGLAEFLAPRLMANATGVRNTQLLQLYGVREIVCGVGVLTTSRPVAWMWARVAGDALDLATLGAADDRRRAAGAAVAVAGATALDLLAAGMLTAGCALEGRQ